MCVCAVVSGGGLILVVVNCGERCQTPFCVVAGGVCVDVCGTPDACREQVAFFFFDTYYVLRMYSVYVCT